MKPRFPRIFLPLVLASGAWAIPVPAAAPVPDPEALARQVRFDQNLGQLISTDLVFTNSDGNQTAMSDICRDKPGLLVLGYFQCAQLCDVVLNGLVRTLQEVRPTVGEDFSVIFVSINPADSPAAGARMKATCAKRYGRSADGTGWHFLSGNPAGADQVADEAGFQYVPVPQSDQFAHPSGFIVLAPGGQISKYFLGIDFKARDLHLALVEAGRGDVGTLSDQVLLMCYQYNPLTGRYGLAIWRILQTGGVLTLGVLVGGLLYLKRQERLKEVPCRG